MDTPVHHLQDLGFSQYEAQAYVSLLQHSPLNGYELARSSGVPRANIYHVLDKLQERGAVVRVDAQGSTRFVPIRPEELFQSMRSHLETSLDEAQQSLCQLQVEGDSAQVWNLTGYANLLDQAEHLTGAAQESLLVALSPQESESLTGSLDDAQARGVEITTLCLAGCPHECESCRGRVHRYHLTPEGGMRNLLLVKDCDEVLAGEIGPDESAQGVRTSQSLLVDLAAKHIRDNIALSAIVLDLGGNLEDLLAVETRQVLAALGPSENRTSWLDNIRGLLTNPDHTELN